MKRNWIIPILIAVFLVAVTGFWGYDQYKDKQQLETYLGNNYQQAFYELVNNVEQIQILLGKSLVSASPSQNILNLTDVWKQAITAQAELTKLPISQATLFRTAKFLSQTGDYAHVMARKNSEGKTLSSKNRKQLLELRQQAASLSDSLHKLENKLLDGKVRWEEVVRGTKYNIAREKTDPLSDKFDDIRQDLTKYPTLIYNGPFSDHIAQAKPKGLTGGNITSKEAENRAREVVDFQNKDQVKVKDSKKVTGRIPAYNFHIGDNGDETYSVDISKKGGHLINMINPRSIRSASISIDEAADKAQEYLASIKYPNMSPTYAEIRDNIAYISFAYKPEEIVYYPDIIDVQVALDNGQVLAVEALSYLISHHERDPEEPKISEKEVKKLVNKDLKIESVRLAVIPEAGLEEVFTYEVRGKIGEETYLIYINAETGVEEQILRVIKTESGTFTL